MRYYLQEERSIDNGLTFSHRPILYGLEPGSWVVAK